MYVTYNPSEKYAPHISLQGTPNPYAVGFGRCPSKKCITRIESKPGALNGFDGWSRCHLLHGVTNGQNNTPYYCRPFQRWASSCGSMCISGHAGIRGARMMPASLWRRNCWPRLSSRWMSRAQVRQGTQFSSRPLPVHPVAPCNGMPKATGARQWHRATGTRSDLHRPPWSRPCQSPAPISPEVRTTRDTLPPPGPESSLCEASRCRMRQKFLNWWPVGIIPG